jgi:hypothetical protein
MSGWYYATSPQATFGFEFARGRVVAVAPFGRKWLLGRPVEEAVEELRRRGYVVKRGDVVETSPSIVAASQGEAGRRSDDPAGVAALSRARKAEGVRDPSRGALGPSFEVEP